MNPSAGFLQRFDLEPGIVHGESAKSQVRRTKSTLDRAARRDDHPERITEAGAMRGRARGSVPDGGPVTPFGSRPATSRARNRGRDAARQRTGRRGRGTGPTADKSGAAGPDDGHVRRSNPGGHPHRHPPPHLRLRESGRYRLAGPRSTPWKTATETPKQREHQAATTTPGTTAGKAIRKAICQTAGHTPCMRARQAASLTQDQRAGARTSPRANLTAALTATQSAGEAPVQRARSTVT